MFTPTSMYTWIGINRRSSGAAGQGSGVCRVTCSTLPISLILAVPRDQPANSTTAPTTTEAMTEATDEPEVPAEDVPNQPGEEQEPQLP